MTRASTEAPKETYLQIKYIRKEEEREKKKKKRRFDVLLVCLE